MGYHTDFEGKVEIVPGISLGDFQDYRKRYENDDWRNPTDDRPHSHCDWEISEDGKHLRYSGADKFTNYIEWLHFVNDDFFKPRGYTLHGEFLWDGEERDDFGTITVHEGNIIVTEGK